MRGLSIDSSTGACPSSYHTIHLMHHLVHGAIIVKRQLLQGLLCVPDLSKSRHARFQTLCRRCITFSRTAQLGQNAYIRLQLWKCISRRVGTNTQRLDHKRLKFFTRDDDFNCNWTTSDPKQLGVLVKNVEDQTVEAHMRPVQIAYGHWKIDHDP